jgi:hypothetical protein
LVIEVLPVRSFLARAAVHTVGRSKVTFSWRGSAADAQNKATPALDDAEAVRGKMCRLRAALKENPINP